MLKRFICLAMMAMSCFLSAANCESAETSSKKKILIVSSYHREYEWTGLTSGGICAAFKKFGYIDNDDQIAEYTKNDYVETSKVIMKKMWMNTKRKKTSDDIEAMVVKIANAAKELKPDMIMLGDDNAAKYVGAHFLDSDIPIVFWGVNNTPVKYGLVDSAEKPGHNVTGVYQSGYNKEGIEFLTKLVPSIKTFAILSDDTTTGRTRVKNVEYLVFNNKLSIKLVDKFVSNNSKEWKEKALELQEKVDAFFIAHFSGLEDEDGNSIPLKETAAWFIKNINIPEVVGPGSFVRLGLLCSADDSGYNQGYSAGVIAHDILENGKDPATYSPMAPKRGALIVNKKRGEMLGIKFTEGMGVEEYY